MQIISRPININQYASTKSKYSDTANYKTDKKSFRY